MIDPLRANIAAVCGDLLRRATATPSLHGPGEATIHLLPHSRTPSHFLILYLLHSPRLHCVKGVHTLGSVPLPLLCFFSDHELYPQLT